MLRKRDLLIYEIRKCRLMGCYVLQPFIPIKEMRLSETLEYICHIVYRRIPEYGDLQSTMFSSIIPRQICAVVLELLSYRESIYQKSDHQSGSKSKQFRMVVFWKEMGQKSLFIESFHVKIRTS